MNRALAVGLAVAAAMYLADATAPTAQHLVGAYLTDSGGLKERIEGAALKASTEPLPAFMAYYRPALGGLAGALVGWLA